MEVNDLEDLEVQNIERNVHCGGPFEAVVAENVEVPNDTSHVDILEGKLSVGTIVDDIDNAYLLYCQYAHAKGFSVRRSTQCFFPGTKDIQSKLFKCSCAGEKDEKRCSQRLPDYQKPSTRTGCLAKLKIKREKKGPWTVSKFIIVHNHEMYLPDQSHLIRSSRNLSYAKKSTLEAMVNAGITVANAVSYMENEACGPRNLGFIRKDAYDHIDRLKKHTKVENGDAVALIQYFINKSNKENSFYWNVQLDDDDRVMNFFFRDYSCLVDYKYFGDVLSIDTTYRTNKYNLICAPFVGINHHMKNVMFGLAFMSDETEKSFERLFKTFLDYMDGKQPQIIFSDQCQAMMNAIETVFPNSHARLCQWHINQNAPSHFGHLNGNSEFKQLWYKCMSHCESEEEFESTWKFMIDSYNLHDHKWLCGMYKLRKKWATAFSNDRFSAGLLATSRSEGTNMVLKKAGNKTCSLYDFVLNYENTQKNWRANEKAEDTRCRHGKAAQILKSNPLLNHAADVYTLTVYELFEIEMVKSLNCKFVEQPSTFDNNWDWLEFKVRSHGESQRIRQVVINKHTHEVKCTCHKFETMGILCRHILMVFNNMDVTVLPDSYILKRWMRNARNRGKLDFQESDCNGGSGHVSEMVFVNQTMRSTYDLAQLSKPHSETRDMLTTMLDTAKDQILNFVENLNIDDTRHCDDIPGDEQQIAGLQIRNPLTAKSRGLTNACITRHWDDKIKKGKGKGKGKRKADTSGYGRKVQNSQCTTNSRTTNSTPPSQFQNNAPPQFPNNRPPPQYFPSQNVQFSSPEGSSQPSWQYPNQGGGNGNIYLGGQLNLFGYSRGPPHF